MEILLKGLLFLLADVFMVIILKNLKVIKQLFVCFSLLLFSNFTQSQVVSNDEKQIEVSRLMDSLWIHPSSFLNHNDPNWIRLNQHLKYFDILKLNNLIHSIFYGKSSFLLNRSHALEGFIGTLNKNSNDGRSKHFHKKIRQGFRDPKLYPEHKIVMVEGDSWFEYPVFLKDIGDFLEKKPNIALYSQAHGSDWMSNMISSLEYEYDYVRIKPDVFIISGGGNDMVGDYRLSNFILLKPLSPKDPAIKNYENYVISRISNKPSSIGNSGYDNVGYPSLKDSIPYFKTKIDTVLLSQIVTGRQYLNKNFYRFLATIKIEYKMLFESLKKIDIDQFNSIKIITQGYDYPIPSFKKGSGINKFLKNGQWLKEPLMFNGINDPYLQKSIMKTILFEVNEMLIELGRDYNNVYHVDSRGITAFYEKYKGKKPGSYWYDELHPKSQIFSIISDVFTDVIEDKIPKKERVIDVVNEFKRKNNLK